MQKTGWITRRQKYGFALFKICAELVIVSNHHSITKETNLMNIKIPTAAFLISWLVCFVAALASRIGPDNLTNFAVMAKHPQAMFEYLAQGLGGALPIPAIALVVCLLIPNFRNSDSRRTAVVWSSAVTVLVTLIGLIEHSA